MVLLLSEIWWMFLLTLFPRKALGARLRKVSTTFLRILVSKIQSTQHCGLLSTLHFKQRVCHLFCPLITKYKANITHYWIIRSYRRFKFMAKALYLMHKASARFFLHHTSGSNLGKMRVFLQDAAKRVSGKPGWVPREGGLQFRKITLRGNLYIYAEVEVLLY